jgi:exosortase A-associated hydrolase 1
MGDAGGEFLDFTAVNADIEAAVEAFCSCQPEVREVVLWGLCDAASAALFYGWQDPRVTGMVLLNPWVRTETGQARAYLRHYYLQRLIDGNFWRKLLSGTLDWTDSLRSLGRQLKRVYSGESRHEPDSGLDSLPLPERMAEGLARFHGRILFILSGQDLTAAEFRDTVDTSPRWKELMEQSSVSREDLAEADHTFSRRSWRDDVARRTCRWVESI